MWSCLFCNFSPRVEHYAIAARGIHLDAAAFQTDSLNDLGDLLESAYVRGVN
jgi:hypothetical protein